MRNHLTIVSLAALLFSVPAQSETGDMLVKLRGGYALRSGTDTVSVNVNSNPVKAKAQDGVLGEAALTIFFSDHLATEVAIGGGPYDIDDATGRTLASAGQVTSTLLVQYHPMPDAKVRPYLGAGAAYVSLYSEKPGAILTSQNPLPPVSYSIAIKSNIAPVAQVGVDISVNDKFYVNVDGRYLMASSRVKVAQGTQVQTANQDMKSFVVMAGVGFKF